ncbi:MaoC/PaaZ C-terminal domain-containing protein [Propionicimonas sp.]|uniref:MaoC/PaaZ C-terminal domain-containing protein n=1 Tax=Propionicimonas sp. TaxID=1955623 RepID=UPI0039E45569
MTDIEIELLPALPALGPLFAKTLVPRLHRGPAHVPSRTVLVRGVTQDVARLAGYDRVCGFALRDRVPPTWLHVLAFPLHVHLLSDPGSTIGLAGAVHVSNRMRLHRPVAVGESLDLSVRIDNLRPHRRGALLDLVAAVRVADEVVWDGVSTYLAQGASVPGAPVAIAGEEFPARPPIATWRLPADLGREYRRVSGDPNPIHTSRVAARAFGFARPIIHGMWTHARLLAAVEPRLAQAYAVEVRFTRPIPLPATVGAWWQQDEPASWRAAVTTRDGTRPHLLAQITP